MIFGHSSEAIAAMAAALFVFGAAYNGVVAWLERHTYDEGYTALLVVAGVLVTLGAVALVDANAAGLVLVAFAASGFWMVMGSWWRHVTARRAGQLAHRAEVLAEVGPEIWPEVRPEDRDDEIARVSE